MKTFNRSRDGQTAAFNHPNASTLNALKAMKIFFPHRAVFRLVALLLALFPAGWASAQPVPPPLAKPNPSLLPVLSNNPVAVWAISNMLASPRPPITVATGTRTNMSRPGTYWTLSSPAPLPMNPFAGNASVPVAEIGSNIYVINDLSVDYSQLKALPSDDVVHATAKWFQIDPSKLWLEVLTNTPTLFTVGLHQTVVGQKYDFLTKGSLTHPAWTTEATVLATNDVTRAALNRNGRTNLFVWAQASGGNVTQPFTINMPPLSQTVEEGDMVTFSVSVSGGVNVHYQWYYNNVVIAGATNSSYTIAVVQPSDAGGYAVKVMDNTSSETTAAAQLTVDTSHPFGYAQWHDFYLVPLLSQRQDYTFKNGYTYYIASPVSFYGQTTIEGGAVLKFEWQPQSTVQIMGTLVCRTEPYFPAILTASDDETVGESLGYTTTPGATDNGVAYLDLSQAQGAVSLSNLRFSYAFYGVITPAAGLDVWDSQFLQCYYGVVSLASGAKDTLHNVLWGGCYYAVGAGNNVISVEGEQLSAYTTRFSTSLASGSRMALTNSFYWNNALAATTLITNNVIRNPNTTNFVIAGAGGYYLSSASPYHKAGTANISARLQQELQSKSTYAPLVIPVGTTISGSLTLAPQAGRCTNGAPDIGYHYDALDYLVSELDLAGGTLTVLPGVAVGLDGGAAQPDGHVAWWGLSLDSSSTLQARGLADRPIVFTDAQLVQEQPTWPCQASFLPNFLPGAQAVPPVMDFRFCRFYNSGGQYEFFAGFNYGKNWEVSYNSLVDWTMRDCTLHGGMVNLGKPDDGSWNAPIDYNYGSASVHWQNNVFDEVHFNLEPSYLEYGYLNCDLQIIANNNLFKCGYINMQPVPASAGNWAFRDNVFDHVTLWQDTLASLDNDHNGYTPGSATLIGSAGSDVKLLQPLTYQTGTFGNYYLSSQTPLYQAGSQTAGNAGLAQSTTLTSQAKEVANKPVSIGFHYIAANGTKSLDTDSDGVPDYLEDANGNGLVDANETDPAKAKTDSITPDASSTVYDDVDLSGNGLVGRIKKALGQNPLDASNPLTLKQVVTGDEPQIITFEVPVKYSIMANLGEVKLFVDGNYVSWQATYAGTNGNCWIEWNSIYCPPGPRLVQANLNIRGMNLMGDTANRKILSGQGPLMGFNSTNVIQFDDAHLDFNDSGATFYATTPACPDASYTIELQTTNGVHIKTITGITSTGVISENWDLTDDKGNKVNNDNVDAIFNVTLLDPGSSKGKQRVTKSDGVIDGDFTIAYAFNNGTIARNEMWDCVQYGVVDPLISPLTSGGGGSMDPYKSTFNDFSSYGDPGNPGLLTSSNDVVSLLNNLKNPATRNFFMMGHGSITDIGDGANPSQVDMFKNQVGEALGNGYTQTSKVIQRKHPYRFVFLYGCHTAEMPEWSDAFGIRQSVTADQARNGMAQAFIGWQGSPFVPPTSADWNNFSIALGTFFYAWMNSADLTQCRAAACNPSLAWPFTKPYPAGSTNSNDFKLKIYGYPQLKRRN